VITNILFTRLITSEIIQKHFGNNVEVACRPTLKVDYISVDEINNNIDHTIEQYIVTSQNTVNAIRDLDLNGHFFVVGHKTALQLKAQNRNVILVENYAEDLAKKIIDGDYQAKWNFLCGSSRRDLLINELEKVNHKVNEVITYYSEQINYKLDNIYDAYVFFSPLSFKAFNQENDIPESSCIFTIGNTTTSAIQEVYPNHKIITATIPLLEEVLENIKKYIDDKE